MFLRGDFLANSTSRPNPTVEQLKLFDQNLRKTNLGVTFAKKLFTDPNSLQVKDALSIMKTLGLDLPPEMNWTVDALQVYVSGQAVYSGAKAIQAASTVTDLKAATSMTGGGIHALTSLAQSNWGLDADSASIIHIGTDVAMIIASAGMDVTAWLDLGLRIASIGPSKQALADYKAVQELQKRMNEAGFPKQLQIFSSKFKEYQNGQTSIYDLIVSAALEAPHVFPQLIKPGSPLLDVFPGLGLLPVVSGAWTGHGEAAIRGSIPFNGDYVIASWSSNKSQPYVVLKDAYNTEVLAEYLFGALVKPWSILYILAGAEAKKRGTMAMNHIAMLSYLWAGDTGRISATDNYVDFMYSAFLTPYDLGDRVLDKLSQDYIDKKYNYNRPTYLEQAVSSGKAVSLTEFDNYNADVLKRAANIQKTIRDGKIERMVSDPEIYAKLRAYTTYSETFFEKDPSIFNKIDYQMNYSQPEQKIKYQSWRELGNYFATLNMIDEFRKNPILQKTRFAQELEFLFGTYNSFDADFKRVQQLSYGRAVNNMAELNIASFVGTSVDKLVYQTPKDGSYQGPTIVTVK